MGGGDNLFALARAKKTHRILHELHCRINKLTLLSAGFNFWNDIKKIVYIQNILMLDKFYTYIFGSSNNNTKDKNFSQERDYILFYNNRRYPLRGISPRNAFERAKYELALRNISLDVNYYDINNQILQL